MATHWSGHSLARPQTPQDPSDSTLVSHLEPKGIVGWLGVGEYLSKKDLARPGLGPSGPASLLCALQERQGLLRCHEPLYGLNGMH